MIPEKWIEDALERVTPHIVRTPLTYDPELDLLLKWENHQVTGSFKVRGAFSKVYGLQPWERERGLVAASAGNHGAGVALAARTVNAQAIIFVAETAVESKIQAMVELGAEIHKVPGGYGDAERAGSAFAAENELTWISPYNDGQVIAGQATLGLEVLSQVDPAMAYTWIVPVGGGGLLAGIVSAIQYSARQVDRDRGVEDHRIIGVQSEASPFMHALYHKGSQEGIIELSSLADGLAGRIEDNSITVPLLKNHVSEILLVSEKEIASAIAYAWKNYKERIEGSAAAALAAAMTGRIPSRPAIAIITGGNISSEVHSALCTDPV